MTTRFRFSFCFKKCLFGGVKLPKNVDPYKCSFSGYGIGFHTGRDFLLLDASGSKNVIIFGVDMSSSVHNDNKGKEVTAADTQC